MSAPSGEGDSLRVVIAALTGNLLIAISKFVAAFFSGSAATLAEAVHSVADTVNQVLLMVGLRRAARRPTLLHPFGHAVESYFWPFLVSIMIFLLGGAFAIYEGIEDLHELFAGHPVEPPGSRIWSYAVLGTSFAFESYSCFVAAREFQKMRKGRSVWETLMHAKDPTIPVVLMEDTAALLGLGIALVSVALSHVTGWSGFDAIGSLLIGCVLGGVAWVLARRTHSLLLGEAASPEDRALVETIAREVPGVDAVTQLLSMHLGPQHVLLALKVGFDRNLAIEGVEAAIDTLESRIREALPHMRFIFVEPDSDYLLERDPERPVPVRGFTK
ncbi:cation diffusion facilitator family transporter [Sandaracinus amylolyticus]|uniref:cation diffusion facilitator family transporter n=1 Tax=Sandaracinus amylolyticus TaxID=927083 RepID=UPI001F0117E0|nr:cation diffusion facilitator family transporter [Sandaracinus amylolyticus]UJR81969.1 Ferrous-iron efflux pump FieF [Sandaracinus amylolyticus]